MHQASKIVPYRILKATTLRFSRISSPTLTVDLEQNIFTILASSNRFREFFKAERLFIENALLFGFIVE